MFFYFVQNVAVEMRVTFVKIPPHYFCQNDYFKVSFSFLFVFLT